MLLNFINTTVDWLSNEDRIFYSLTILGLSTILILQVVFPVIGKIYLNNTASLDLQYFGYSFEKAQEFLEKYEEVGRKNTPYQH
jgi:hypothetical protein